MTLSSPSSEDNDNDSDATSKRIALTLDRQPVARPSIHDDDASYLDEDGEEEEEIAERTLCPLPSYCSQETTWSEDAFMYQTNPGHKKELRAANKEARIAKQKQLMGIRDDTPPSTVHRAHLHFYHHHHQSSFIIPFIIHHHHHHSSSSSIIIFAIIISSSSSIIIITTTTTTINNTTTTTKQQNNNKQIDAAKGRFSLGLPFTPCTDQAQNLRNYQQFLMNGGDSTGG
ncbi:hypothetical protein (Partial), partial [Seminavis robusta]|eukprot:Sro1194_g251340.1 n/a (228) ;mRNA; f:33854-34538